MIIGSHLGARGDDGPKRRRRGSGHGRGRRGLHEFGSAHFGLVPLLLFLEDRVHGVWWWRWVEEYSNEQGRVVEEGDDDLNRRRASSDLGQRDGD